MKQSVEKAFKEADKTARLLGDMKHGIYSLKTVGGMSDIQKIYALAQFADEAEGYIDIMRKQIEIAYEELKNGDE